MALCRHNHICGLTIYDEKDPAAGLCILHSKDPLKNKEAFENALGEHREKKGDDFSLIVFPGYVDFSATFTGEAKFVGADFNDRVSFFGATFTKDAIFLGTTFNGETSFTNATFAKKAMFNMTSFKEEVSFFQATFTEEADFRGTTFSSGANFEQAKFNGTGVNFYCSTFRGRTLFSSRREEDRTVPIFSDAEVDFRQVLIDPPDALSFREADLRKFRFLDTDLRKVGFTGVLWPKIGGRFGVYDEIAPLEAGGSRPWARLEKLYREIKQNYEDRRDYERAGDFHYGEKEMRRRNPETPFLLRFFLTLYWMFSGYGERYVRPLIWAGVLLAVSTVGYLALGLSPKVGGSILAWTNLSDWLRAAFYSFRVMTFLRPDDLMPIGYAKIINALESLLGPLFLGLFALAVRQRLKR